MLTTCRVIFFIISACLFYICIKRKCLRTRVPPRDNVGGLCWLLPPPPPRSNRLNRVRGCSSLLVAGRWTGRDLVARKERLLFIPDPLGRDLLFQTAPRGGVEWNRLFGIWKEGLHCDFFTYRCKYNKYVYTSNLILLFVVRDNHGCKL